MQSIGKYEVVRVLGEGGMGRVYEAIDPMIGRRVAIKTISGNVIADEEARARFFREAQAAGRLSHPNLITIHDIGETDGSPYIVMEYLEGTDLGGAIRGGRLSFATKLQIMIDICEGLAYAHGRDVVHRDIKPANIFVTAQGHLKILDFGLARGSLSDVTQTGRIVGTPNYMAPEQIRGEEVDHRADIFAAGVVFYELLSGRKAFEGDTVATTLYKVLETQPEPLHRVNTALSPAISSVVERALAKEKIARYQTTVEMLDALRQVDSSHARAHRIAVSQPASAAQAAVALPPPPTPPRGSRRPLAIGAAIVFAIGAIAGTAVLMRPSPRHDLNAAAARNTGPADPPPSVVPAAPPPEPAEKPAAAVQPPARASEASRGTSPRAPSQTLPADRPTTKPAQGAIPTPTPPFVADRPSVPQPMPVQAEPPALPSAAPVPPPPITPGVSAGTVAPPPVPHAEPKEAAAPSESPVEAAHAVLVKYQLALESRDLDALRRIWPGLSGRQADAIKTEFDRARAISVRLDGVSVSVNGGGAVVSCRRDYVVTTLDGQTLKTATTMLMTLSSHGGAWTIDAVRHEVVR
jgi:eukaryotic-like serine/threonine-protein kinase